MSKILVTGGAGYVGSLLVPELLDKGHEVKVFDWMLFDPHIFDNLIDHPKLKIIKGDLRDEYAVERALQDIEDVIHLGCLSNDPSCDINEELTREINFDAGMKLVQLSKKNGIRRFFNASSASVYGIKEEENVTEDFSLEPITAYSKYKAELEAVLNGEISDSFSGVTVRPATLCGYAPRQRFDLALNILTYQAVTKGKISVFGGEQKRPNLTVRDMVDIYMLLLDTPIKKINGEVFNVTAENHKIIELAELVKDTLEKPVEIEITPTNDHRSYHMSAEKIQRVLGYTPKYGIREGIRELAEAIQNGKLGNPADSKYRNVQFMNENFKTWSSVGQSV
ncbi:MULTISPECIES: NAD(P)-dependent oxidoreductase [unclassified Bacillus (in: firmicutes)]|uniref:NAD-dependent epimerase/dehydratase family protein n=1 Tax=unclassified Bacillus (in: firmicutes) TaxID=185979 RepID=UPI000BF930D7|nr:SDR family oxidoreductase [Bacillus sp. AFS059628]PFV83103.1 UDP-glucose 4-epimerase [Bacillus sp. AFS059628]